MSLEHRDPTALVLGRLSGFDEQIEVSEHLGQRQVRLCDRHVSPHLQRNLVGGEWAGIEELLPESDVVSLHSPLFPETQGMINSRTLPCMKSTAFLINTSRGPLVVDRDLADALNAGRLAGAAVDVLSIEPPAADNPLLTARNCLVTPHIAWATREARGRLMDLTIRNISAFLNGNPVNVIK